MTTAALDYDTLGHRTLGNAGLMAELLTMFRDETTAGLADLRTAVDARDTAAARTLAHRMKGSAATIAAAALARLLSDAESRWAAGDTSAADLLPAIETEAARCLAEIDARPDVAARG